MHASTPAAAQAEPEQDNARLRSSMLF